MKADKSHRFMGFMVSTLSLVLALVVSEAEGISKGVGIH